MHHYAPVRAGCPISRVLCEKRATTGASSFGLSLAFQLLTSVIQLQFPKLNASNKSSNAGLLVGTYGLPVLLVEFGKLSRLVPVMVGRLQFLSMNLMSETWSP